MSTTEGYQQRPSVPSAVPQTSPQSVLGKHPRDDSDAATSTEQSKDTPTKLFRCGDCDKSYSRVDHLARHVRIHTQVGQSLPFLNMERYIERIRNDLMFVRLVGKGSLEREYFISIAVGDSRCPNRNCCHVVRLYHDLGTCRLVRTTSYP